MKKFNSSTLLLAVAASTALALAGCSTAAEAPAGSGSPSAGTENAPTEQGIQVPEASQILPKSAKVIKSATSVSMSGEVSKGGEIVKLDLAGTHDSSNYKATVNMNGGNFELLTVDGTSYLKADESFFAENVGGETPGLVAAMVGDKWISTSDASAFGDFSVGTMLESMAAEDLEDFDSDKITTSSLEDLDGVKAFKYTGEENAFWIAAEGEPYLLQVEGSDTDGGGSGNLTFSDWNSVELFEAPPESETLGIPGF